MENKTSKKNNNLISLILAVFVGVIVYNAVKYFFF